jgi:polar amino acid transport system permease protein
MEVESGMSVQALEPRPPIARSHWLARVPYWLVAAIGLALYFLWVVANDATYTVIFRAVATGVSTTLWVTLVAYTGALMIGLLIGILRVARNRVIFEVTSFYVEIVRGVPILVLLYYIAFVGAPGLVELINWLGLQLSALGLTWLGAPLAEFSVRRLDFAARAILALIIGYSAFVSEIFRAGIESIDKGQSEAAMSLGMSRWQTMWYVILPQAVRRVLPPLGNDFIAMLKDSALVSALGVQDITRLGNSYAASTFRYFETYNVVAFLYLVMTVALALFVRYLERRVPNR